MHGLADHITDILPGALTMADGAIRRKWWSLSQVTDTARLMEREVRAAPKWAGNMSIEAAGLITGILPILIPTGPTQAGG